MNSERLDLQGKSAVNGRHS